VQEVRGRRDETTGEEDGKVADRGRGRGFGNSEEEWKRVWG
jgi:hypothetical protein